jgi:chemotaxis protein CheD
VSLVVVGVADMKVSADPDATLATYALGSCIAVAIHDPLARVAGMLHYMLPESGIDAGKAERSPFMFADTGIPLLFRAVTEKGADKRRLSVRLVGGAQVMDAEGVFNIGKRNYLAAKKILWKAGVLIGAEEVGGSVSRTIRLEVDSGRLWMRTGGGTEQEIMGGRNGTRAAVPLSTKGGAAWDSRC